MSKYIIYYFYRKKKSRSFRISKFGNMIDLFQNLNENNREEYEQANILNINQNNRINLLDEN